MGTIIKKVIIVVLKLLPLNLYYLIHIIDAFRYDGILNIIATAMFTGTLFMPLAGWGLIAFEIFLFTENKSKKGVITVIISGVFSVLSMYILVDVILAYVGFWRFPLVLVLVMNVVYILAAILIMCFKNGEQVW
ncbi:MAG: hypothetical protein J5802_13200 [Butyrivibrio sp.]|nr:hypothetical protein [Butyrivibrio sp.]